MPRTKQHHPQRHLPIAVRVHHARPPSTTGKRYQRFAEETVKISDYLKLVHQRMISQSTEYGAVSYIAQHNTIKRSTLQRHWQRWRERIRSDGFTEQLIAEINAEHRGGSNKAMTNNEETTLYQRLSSLNDDSNINFTNQVIKETAKDIVNQRSAELRSLQQPFEASDGWVWLYKKRFDMYSGPRQSKDPRKPPNDIHVTNYVDECQRLVKSSGTLFYFNCDETKWHLINEQRIVVIRRGVPPTIQSSVKKSHGFTAILGGNANGDKLRPSIIIKGDDDKEMQPYVDKYGDSIGIYRTESGWSNSDIICSVIRNDIMPLLTPLTRGQKATLVLDKYGGHNADAVYTMCDDNNINLVMVPGSATPICQPMDITTIGATKSHAKTLYTRWQMSHIGEKITDMDAIDMLVQSWNKIARKAVVEGFQRSMNYTAWPSDVSTEPCWQPPSARKAETKDEVKPSVEPLHATRSSTVLPSVAAASLVALSRPKPKARGAAVFDFPGMVGDKLIDENIADKQRSKRVKH
jgi:transposase-like protein